MLGVDSTVVGLHCSRPARSGVTLWPDFGCYKGHAKAWVPATSNLDTDISKGRPPVSCAYLLNQHVHINISGANEMCKLLYPVEGLSAEIVAAQL